MVRKKMAKKKPLKKKLTSGREKSNLLLENENLKLKLRLEKMKGKRLLKENEEHSFDILSKNELKSRINGYEIEIDVDDLITDINNEYGLFDIDDIAFNYTHNQPENFLLDEPFTPEVLGVWDVDYSEGQSGGDTYSWYDSPNLAITYVAKVDFDKIIKDNFYNDEEKKDFEDNFYNDDFYIAIQVIYEFDFINESYDVHNGDVYVIQE